jgi:hypothetical protein
VLELRELRVSWHLSSAEQAAYLLIHLTRILLLRAIAHRDVLVITVQHCSLGLSLWLGGRLINIGVFLGDRVIWGILLGCQRLFLGWGFLGR